MTRALPLLLVAGALLAAAALLARLPSLPAGALHEWSRRHPEPRVLDAQSEQLVADQIEGEWRRDLVLLLCGLAAGCAATAARPKLAELAGGPAAAVLLVGSVGLGLWQLGASAVAQVRGLRAGTWTLADDDLRPIAGVHAETLRVWQQTIGPHDAVIVVGSEPWLWDAVNWALHPRPLYPMVLDIRPETSVDQVQRGARGLRVGRDAPARWIVDLGVLARGTAAAHPPLIKVDA